MEEKMNDQVRMLVKHEFIMDLLLKPPTTRAQ